MRWKQVFGQGQVGMGMESRRGVLSLTVYFGPLKKGFCKMEGYQYEVYRCRMCKELFDLAIPEVEDSNPLIDRIDRDCQQMYELHDCRKGVRGLADFVGVLLKGGNLVQGGE